MHLSPNDLQVSAYIPDKTSCLGHRSHEDGRLQVFKVSRLLLCINHKASVAQRWFLEFEQKAALKYSCLLRKKLTE